MPITLGIHRVTNKTQLTELMEAAQSENKRVIVTLGRQGREVRVQPKDGRVLEFFRSLTGQTQRENQRLLAFRDALPVASPAIPQPNAQVAMAFDRALGTEASVAARPQQADPGSDHTAHGHTDSLQQNPQLYATDPEFGVGGLVNGHYVQRQFGNCCFAHALASYFGKPVFQSEADFLKFRNESYDRVAKGIVPDEGKDGLNEMKSRQLSEIFGVQDVLERLQADPTLSGCPAPWTQATFRLSADPKKASDSLKGEHRAQVAAQIDAAFTHLASVSESKRFLVRSGGESGHFQTLVHDAQKNPGAPWTLLNSSKNPNANSPLPDVRSGSSPAELLNALGVRNLTLAIWTQSTDGSANVAESFLDQWQAPA
jgi:hypothetical protein